MIRRDRASSQPSQRYISPVVGLLVRVSVCVCVYSFELWFLPFFGLAGAIQNQGLLLLLHLDAKRKPCYNLVIPTDSSERYLILIIYKNSGDGTVFNSLSDQIPPKKKRMKERKWENSLNYDPLSEWAMRLIAIGSSTNGQIWNER